MIFIQELKEIDNVTEDQYFSTTELKEFFVIYISLSNNINSAKRSAVLLVIK